MNDNLSDMQSELVRLNTKIIQVAWKISDVEKAVNMEAYEDCQSSIDDMKNRIGELDGRINEVYDKISDIENRYEQSESESRQQIPHTNLISHSLWKRMWAVFGHGVLLYGLLAILVYALITKVF